MTRLALCGLISLLLEASGCAGALPSQPDAGFLLVGKAKGFFEVSAILFAQDSSVWGQGLRSMYYCALTLARIKDVRMKYDPGASFHEKVWNASRDSVRGYFRDTLRPLRTKYDYTPLGDAAGAARDDLEEFLRNGPSAFEKLVRQTKDSLELDYDGCAKDPAKCRQCSRGHVAFCLRERSLADLGELDKKFKEMYAKHRGE
jgi:hypothetical protein